MAQDTHQAKVLSGPSGVGKDTIIGELIKAHKELLAYSVSHTTRKPRSGEENGKDYWFVSHDEFRDGISKNLFVEHAEVHGNFYGTSVQSVKSLLDAGKVPLINVDVQGATRIRGGATIDAHYLFILPASMQQLEQRLRSRGTETEAAIQTRLRNSHAEVHRALTSQVYDLFLVNDDLALAVEECQRLLLHKGDIHSSNAAGQKLSCKADLICVCGGKCAFIQRIASSIQQWNANL